MNDDLVIFEDLPSTKTPLNAHNLNHNFDVYNKQIKAETDKIDTALQGIETAKTELQNDINEKSIELEKKITDSKTELETEIGEQIAKITTLQIEVVQALPTDKISKTTIYLIKPENLPQDMLVQSVKKNITKDNLVISPLSNSDIRTVAITQDDYYFACFYVNNDWVVVGSTTTDLSNYIKRNELPSLETDPTVPTHVKTITTSNISNWDNINSVLEMLGLDKDTFSTSKTYLVGDYVVKDHVLYKCIKAVTTAGTWNSSNWEKSYFFQAN